MTRTLKDIASLSVAPTQPNTTKEGKSSHFWEFLFYHKIFSNIFLIFFLCEQNPLKWGVEVDSKGPSTQENSHSQPSPRGLGLVRQGSRSLELRPQAHGAPLQSSCSYGCWVTDPRLWGQSERDAQTDMPQWGSVCAAHTCKGWKMKSLSHKVTDSTCVYVLSTITMFGQVGFELLSLNNPAV